MTCEEALILISGQLDGQNTEEETAQLREHLEVCSSCRDLLATLEEIDSGVLSLEEAAPEDLCANVMDAICREVPRKRNRHSRWTAVVVAAALVLVVGAGTLRRPVQKDSAQMQTVETYAMLADAGVGAPAAKSFRAVSRSASVVCDPQKIADAKGAPVAVVPELYYEMETCELEQLEDGNLLYILPGVDAAAQLCREYAGELYEPVQSMEGSVSYAVILP